MTTTHPTCAEEAIPVNPQHERSHPLEAIALLRRWPPSPLRDLLYTGMWNTIIALLLASIGMMFDSGTHGFSAYFLPTLVIAQITGFLTHASLLALDRLSGGKDRLHGARRRLYRLGVVAVCACAGIMAGMALLQGGNPFTAVQVQRVLPFALFGSVILWVVLVAGERRAAADLQLARQGELVAKAATALAEARLAALQAQIEPHFLYNTLANVVGLIGPQPAQARHMLERFIDYLRASLAASRAAQSTVGAELDLAAAWLDVLAVRMGARLSYRIEAGDDCRALPMAPMLLQALVENAVQHGLEPLLQGGQVTISASVLEGCLRIEVSDNGAGLAGAQGRAPKPGGGVGLSNIRERLRSLYGAAARVQLLENVPCGITTRLVLPLVHLRADSLQAALPH